LFSRFSFWIQLFFGAVSGLVLLFAMLGRNMSEQTNNAGIGFGVFLALVGLYWCALEYFGIFAIGF
jgi:apolipoprotein N-acyltransferase